MATRIPLPNLKGLVFPKVDFSKIPKADRSKPVRMGARHIDRERLHKYSCGHSVEKHNCMFPPSHREPAVRINQRDDDVVLYDIKCNFCEERDVVSRIVVNSIKEQIRVMTGGLLRMSNPSGPDPVKVKWLSRQGKRRLIAITICYFKEGTHGEEIEEVKATAYPARKLDGDRSHQWENISVDMTFESQVRSTELKVCIKDQLRAFEENWNELNQPQKPKLNTAEFSEGPDLFESADFIGIGSLFEE